MRLWYCVKCHGVWREGCYGKWEDPFDGELPAWCNRNIWSEFLHVIGDKMECHCASIRGGRIWRLLDQPALDAVYALGGWDGVLWSLEFKRGVLKLKNG